MKTMREFIQHRVETLDKKHGNAIPIFGGALWVYDEDDNLDFDRFMSGLAHIPESAKFFKWHGGVADALRTFCNICMVDPVVIEVYMGAKFEEICKE